jgi:hypothetical protein
MDSDLVRIVCGALAVALLALIIMRRKKRQAE